MNKNEKKTKDKSKSEEKVEVVKKEGETTLNHIEKLILKAQTSKPEVQDLVDKITNIFVPSILILSFGS